MNQVQLKDLLTTKDLHRVDKIWDTKDLDCQGEYNWIEGTYSDSEAGFGVNNRNYDTDLTFSRWSLWQLLGRACRIPIRFWDRCSLPLQVNIFNEHARGKPQELLFRLDPKRSMDKRIFDGDDGAVHVRAVLSSTYGVINDTFLYPIVTKILEDELGLEEYDDFYYDAHLSRLVVIEKSTQLVSR